MGPAGTRHLRPWPRDIPECYGEPSSCFSPNYILIPRTTTHQHTACVRATPAGYSVLSARRWIVDGARVWWWVAQRIFLSTSRAVRAALTTCSWYCCAFGSSYIRGSSTHGSAQRRVICASPNAISLPGCVVAVTMSSMLPPSSSNCRTPTHKRRTRRTIHVRAR